LEIFNDDQIGTTIGDGFGEITTGIGRMDAAGILHPAQSVVVATVMHRVSVCPMSDGIQRRDDKRAKDLAGEGQRIVLGMRRPRAFREAVVQRMMGSLVSM
jgi:hypothetical protein